jgi:hypothetical protein
MIASLSILLFLNCKVENADSKILIGDIFQVRIITAA